jgi:hypothetical protein
MYNLDLLIGTILLLIANSVSVEDDAGMLNISDLAFDSIKDAQFAGADVSALTTNFNNALDLISQAEKSDFRSCASYEDCKQQAIGMFVQITSDAHILEDQARLATTVQKLLNIAVYAPTAAFIASVLGYSIFKVWKSHQINKLLDMEIEIKQR